MQNAVLLAVVVTVLGCVEFGEDNGSRSGTCAKEGESIMAGESCCPGLNAVSDCLPWESCPISLRYCINCGDTVCGEHENCYNCKTDCALANCPKKPEESECSADSDCKTAGCSGQLCLPAEKSDVVTTCEYRPEYGCLKMTNCKCITGRCLWEKTQDYNDCMNSLK